jgi:hypothetical protein
MRKSIDLIIALLLALFMLTACNLPVQQPVVPTAVTPADPNVSGNTGIECTALECENQLTVKLWERVPDDYVVELITDNEETVRVHCVEGVNVDGSGQYGEPICAAWGVTFPAAPAVATVKLLWENYQLTQEVKPRYEKVQPNGPDCAPICFSAEIGITVPTNP